MSSAYAQMLNEDDTLSNDLIWISYLLQSEYAKESNLTPIVKA